MNLRFFVFIFFHLFGICAMGQTCCSARAPISTFVEIATANPKSISIQLNYEYKSINLLVDNNRRLENDPRSRLGQTLSLKLDYTLNSKFAFSALIPLVYNSRNTSSESQNSLGIGDLTLFSQYRLFASESHDINISAGVKLPLGITNHQGTSQIILSPDMQSGSGSFDFLAGASYSNSDFLLPFMSNFVSIVYRKNGTNDSFGSRDNFGGRSFAFGDELVSLAGLRYTHTTKIGFLIPDVSLKMRWAKSNKEQNVDAPNSGGNWLSLPFGLSFVPDESMSFRLYTEIPLSQNLDGLQITTDFVFGVQLIYNRNGTK